MRALSTIFILVASVTFAMTAESTPAMTEEMRAIGLARLRAAMLAYPPAGVFIDAAAVPPYVLSIPPEQDKK